jgi:hypothetical protein
MKVLISPATLDEARVVVEQGADIVDVKNPAEGSLGAQPPGVIRAIAALARRHGIAVSAAIGDLPAKPGTAALAALGAATCQIDYLKAGLFEASDLARATDLLRAIVDAVRAVAHRPRVVATGYADFGRIASVSPLGVVAAAEAAGCQAVMLDTAIKDGTRLWQHLDMHRLAEFVAAGRRGGLEVALAGSLAWSDVDRLAELAPDIIGVRGAVCVAGDRGRPIDARRVRQFLATVRDRSPAALNR